MNKSLLLVDLSGIFHARWHASAGQDVDTAFRWTVEAVRRHASDFTRVAICCDSKRSWRKDFATSYKANRPPTDLTMIDQLQRCVEELAKDHAVFLADGFEGDDIIATMVKWCREQEIAATIYGSDKDLLALVGPGINVLSPMTGALLDEAGVEAYFARITKSEHRIGPKDVRDYLALCGDASDNVKGVPGVGPKHAARLLAAFGSIEGIGLALSLKEEDGEWQVGPPKIRESLVAAFAPGADGQRPIDIDVKLVTLRDDAPICPEDAFEPIRYVATKPEESWNEESEMSEESTIEAGAATPPQAHGKAPDPPSSTEPTTSAEQPTSSAAGVATGNVEPTTGRGTRSVAAPASIVEVARLEPQANREIILRDDPRWRDAIEPVNPAMMWALAQKMFTSRLFPEHANAEATLAVLLKGRSMGIDAVTSLCSIQIVKGRPRCSAELILALILRSGKAKYFDCLETSATKAVFETQRKGARKPTKLEWTIEMAHKAGLVRPNSAWTAYPATMIRWRCVTELARLVFPDITSGVSTLDEADMNEPVLEATSKIANAS